MNLPMSTRPIRVLVAKPGLDGHDRGALIVAQGLRDAGMEVIYTGLRQTPEQIVAAAVQEDVDCIGLSSLSGAHMALFPAVLDELEKQDARDILVIGGGVIPADDARALQERGIAAIFTPGSTIADMAAYIHKRLRGDTAITAIATDPVPSSVSHPGSPQRIDHIGVAVRSLEEAVSFYRDHLGFAVSDVEELPAQQVRLVFVEAGETRIELLEPTSEASPIARFVAKRGPGLHHVAYRVDDVASRLAYARAAGLRLIDETPRNGAHGTLVAFVHPQAAGGVLTEYCQTAPAGSSQES